MSNLEYTKKKYAYEEKQMQIIKAQNLIRGITREIEELNYDYKNIEKGLKSNIAKLEEEALKAKIRQISLPFDEKDIQLEEEIRNLKMKKDIDISELKVEDFSVNQDYEFIASLQENAVKLKESLKEVLGTDFYDELEYQLASERIRIPKDVLRDFTGFFNDVYYEIENMSKSPMKISKALTRVESIILTSKKDSINNKRNALVITIACGIIVIVATNFILPVYLGLMFIFSTYNTVRSYKTYKAIILLKAVVDNLQDIQEMANNEAIKAFENEKSKIEKRYNRKIESLQQEKENNIDEKNRKKLLEEASFSFDDTESRKSFETTKEQIKEKIKNKERQQKLEYENMLTISKEADQIKIELKELSKTIKDSFFVMDRTATETVFEPTFLLDFDKEGNPVYFKHQQQSSLFLYNSLEDCSNLIRLLSIQLRSKLNPYVFDITVFDPITIGNAVMPFVVTKSENEKNDPGLNRIYQLVTETDGIKAHLAEQCDDLIRRTNLLHGQYKNLAEYNEEMIKIESLTETYSFDFLLISDYSDVATPDLDKLMINGGNLGIFTHIFMKNEDFMKMKEQAVDLIDKIGTIYIIKDGSVNTRAKDFILDKLQQQ